MPPAIRGLYAVTPEATDTGVLLGLLRTALAGGVAVVQYRSKTTTSSQRLEQARLIKDLCDEFRVPLIVNDHLDLAMEIDAAGLHLGGDDGSIREARSRLGPSKWLGASCYDQIALAETALREGADHVAFGSFFASGVKPGAVRAPLELLVEAKRVLAAPVVAIGGITLDNGGQLVRAGADALAVISALFGASDIGETARRFNLLFGNVR